MNCFVYRSHHRTQCKSDQFLCKHSHHTAKLLDFVRSLFVCMCIWQTHTRAPAHPTHRHTHTQTLAHLLYVSCIHLEKHKYIIFSFYARLGSSVEMQKVCDTSVRVWVCGVLFHTVSAQIVPETTTNVDFDMVALQYAVL